MGKNIILLSAFAYLVGLFCGKGKHSSNSKSNGQGILKRETTHCKKGFGCFGAILKREVYLLHRRHGRAGT